MKTSQSFLSAFVSFAAVSTPGEKFHVAVDRYAKLQAMLGPQFDRMFAHQVESEQRQELEVVQSLRKRCVEPDICALLQQMEPQLQRTVTAAQTLTASLR